MQSITLSAPWRKLLLTVHVIATVSVLGADLVLLVLGLSSLGGADPQTIYLSSCSSGRRAAGDTTGGALAWHWPAARGAHTLVEQEA
jgi:hypothetical protein